MSTEKIKSNSASVFKRFSLFLMASVLTFWACQLTQSGGTTQAASFTTLYDELAKYDSVIIVFKDRDGELLDTIYKGKVDKHAEIENLLVRNWDGGMALIDIIGIKDGVVVYKIEKRFDGKTNTTEVTTILVVPGTKLTASGLEFKIIEGDSIPLPVITVNPSTLSDKSLRWTTSNSELIRVGPEYIHGLKPGSANVVVALNTDSSKNISIKFTVDVNVKIPERLILSADTLYVAAGGAPGLLTIQAYPTSANDQVIWRTDDVTVATVASDGAVLGLKSGTTILRALSTVKSSIYDSAIVVVSNPILVESVHFAKESTEIFVRGSAESLIVDVLPPKSNPSVDFIVSDPTKIALKNGRITGLVEGSAFIIAKSKENPTKMDTLIVRVSSIQVVDSVRISPRSLKLFTGGASQNISAQVFPSTASANVVWRSANPTIAVVDPLGKVSPVSPGNIKVYATSLADSTKKDSVDVTIKRDAPQMNIGPDTVIALGQTLSFLPVVAPQEYGLIVQFKWDLDGNAVWDSSSATVKSVSYRFDQEKVYAIRFYVKDTEGNETIMTKNVTAVKGLVVNIVSPANNSYSRVSNINVVWKVNDVAQDSLTTAKLIEGVNTIKRTVKDAFGTPFSASNTVILDSLAPNKPLVHGPSFIPSKQPTWTWATGGSGGNGTYRTALDIENFSSAIEITDTLYKPVLALSEGLHTLFVQERDFAGNWSASGRLTIRIDVTPPSAPTVTVSTPALSKLPRPTWSWTGTGGGIGAFQYKVDNFDFAIGATETSGLSYQSTSDMSAGTHTVYVREKDSTGNWSPLGSVAVTLDFDPPAAPKLTGASPTNLIPKWSWISGGNGGSGTFRSHLGADPTATDAETKLLEFSDSGATSVNTYTLYVQERDAAGNWSPSSNLPITYNLTKPSVNIVLPLESGTHTMSAATSAMSGSSGGPNAITKVTYAYSVVGGTSGTGNASLATGGKWSIVSIPLTEGKATVVTVTATDVLGNSGDAVLTIIRDSMAPLVPTFVDVSTTASPTRNRAPTWTWASGGGGNGTFTYQLGGAAPITTTATSFPGSNLSDGTYTLTVSERDATGNWSNVASRSIQIKGSAPLAPNLSINASPTNAPQWSWVAGGGGNGTFRFKMVGGAYPNVGSSLLNYAPTDLTDGSRNLCVQEQDLIGWGTEACMEIIVDKTGPIAPVVTVNASTATTLRRPTWNWASGSPGETGTFRYKFDSANFIVTAAKSFTPSTDLSGGTHTLYVQQVDAVGNWGTTGTKAVKVVIPGGMVGIDGSLTGNSGNCNWMGSDSYFASNQPNHYICTDDFFIDTYEVTQGDFSALMGVLPSTFINNNNPVDSVTWFDAVLYANARSKRDGLDTVYKYSSRSGIPGKGVSDMSGLFIDYAKNGYRLPTEAEWEKACRAGTTTTFYWGESWDGAYYWTGDNSGQVAHQVGQKLPNSWQLFDMIGNVLEWTNDWYDENYYKSSPKWNPTGPSTGLYRVSRGEKYSSTEFEQSFSRNWNRVAGVQNEDQGFRCVAPKK